MTTPGQQQHSTCTPHEHRTPRACCGRSVHDSWHKPEAQRERKDVATTHQITMRNGQGDARHGVMSSARPGAGPSAPGNLAEPSHTRSSGCYTKRNRECLAEYEQSGAACNPWSSPALLAFSRLPKRFRGGHDGDSQPNGSQGKPLSDHHRQWPRNTSANGSNTDTPDSSHQAVHFNNNNSVR
eukprot:m.54859 g.54859  ORF g.54859 m.54859 type:complete len:183 (-) comp12486_c0_seq1:963-1511(-)